MAQVCDQFSPLHIETLGINTTQSPSGQDDVGDEQWLELIRPFCGARDFHVAGVHANDILCALRPAHWHTTGTTLLPALRDLCVEHPIAMDGAPWDAVLSFVTSRSLSNRPVRVTAPSYQCHICYASFGQQRELQHHLEREHGYQKACLYCDDFECVPGYNFLFPEHIKREHPEVTRNDALLSNPDLKRFRPSQINSLVNRHSSPRAPVTVALSARPISRDFDTGRDTSVA
ncbi:hypothetical protein EDB85DRAFT_1938211 [Lactarius pseudohatsudake]|nr:hypothetical protein EDB85DRAFT_1938211 [Lactarius pseudohatsudake]